MRPKCPKMFRNKNSPNKGVFSSFGINFLFLPFFIAAIMQSVHILGLSLIFLLMLSTVVPLTDCCSSRIFLTKQKYELQFQYTSARSTVLSTPKASSTKEGSKSSLQKLPEPQTNKKSLPNKNYSHGDAVSLEETPHNQVMISSRCPPLFESSYCLNGGRCFSYQIANYTSPSCECSHGFFGERCDSKYLEQSYYNVKPRISVASVCCGAFVAFILATSLAYFCHYRCDKKQHRMKRRAG